MGEREYAVVIAGGGPAGMMLAAELALAKVDVAVVERCPDHVLVGSRAGGFHETPRRWSETASRYPNVNEYASAPGSRNVICSVRSWTAPCWRTS